MIEQSDWLELIGINIFALGLFLAWRVHRKTKSMPSRSTQELQEILSSPHQYMLYRAAILELKARSEDYSGVLLNVLNLLASKNSLERLAGWSVLKDHFPRFADKLPDGDRKITPQLLHAIAHLKSELTNRSTERRGARRHSCCKATALGALLIVGQLVGGCDMRSHSSLLSVITD